MYKGKTASGFEFEIDESALNNMELVDALAASEEDPLEVSRVVRLLLGDAQRNSSISISARRTELYQWTMLLRK